MCRYDDGDYEWMVGATSTVELDIDQRCEDCGRLVPAGEPIVQFLHDVEFNSPYVNVAQDPTHARTIVSPPRPEIGWAGRTYKAIDASKPCLVLPGNYVTADGHSDETVFEALGFIVREVQEFELHQPEPEYSYSCRHCRAADLWLQKVCDQNVVLVTVDDLAEHRYEYSDAELGRDFCTLQTLSAQRWRSQLTGRLIPVDVIDRLARAAAAFAVQEGLAHV